MRAGLVLPSWIWRLFAMKWILFVPTVVSFLLSLVLCRLLIPVLRRLKFGQQVREEGNPEHLKKQGTPTMGGIAVLTAVLATCVFFVFKRPEFLPAHLLTLAFGIIGFMDDYLKIRRRRSEGLKAWQKFLCQLLVTAGFAFWCLKSPAVGSSVILPFTNGKEWDMGWLYVPFVIIAVMGTDNGVNFSDGLDGLCGSITTVVAVFLMTVSMKTGNEGLAVLSGAVAGGLMGFLFFNAYPAKVFMGDTGSLALGGFVASTAIMLRMGWFILVFGLIYLIEVLSVILQVGYFKLTHGKRIFKMAPIHHHFELSGYSETQIVTMFTIVTLLLCLISLAA